MLTKEEVWIPTLFQKRTFNLPWEIVYSGRLYIITLDSPFILEDFLIIKECLRQLLTRIFSWLAAFWVLPSNEGRKTGSVGLYRMLILKRFTKKSILEVLT